MKYTLQCNSCKKQVTVSTKDAIKYAPKDGKYLQISFDCPLCGEEIIAEYAGGKK